jgi:hypothetical protein
MAKKKKQTDTIEKPEIFSDRKLSEIKSDLSKEIKKLKPRKPNLPSQKRLRTMAQKKSEGVLDDAKKMYKDQIELKLLQKTDRELSLENNPPQTVNTQVQSTPMQKAPAPAPAPQQVGSVFKNFSPKDLKGVDDEMLEKYIRMRIIEQKPEYAPFLNESNKKSDLSELIQVMNMVVDLKTSNNPAQQTKNDDSSIVKYMMEQQKQSNEMQMQFMQQQHEQREERLLEKIDELKSQTNVNPFAWLMNKKEEMDALRGLLVNGPNVDGATQVKLEEVKASNRLEKMKFQEKIADKRIDQNKASEFTELIKEGMKMFSETISQAVGSAVGQIGKQQLDNAQLPPFVPIEQIGDQTQFNLPVQPPIIPPQGPLYNPNVNQPKKKYGGFRVSETKEK